MIALRQTVTLAMTVAMLSMTSTTLASTSAIAEDEGPLVAPPSAADLAAVNSPDQAQLIDAVASAPPAQEPAPPMRSTIEQYLQIGAPVMPAFNLEAYQAAQQQLPEFWPKSTPHEQDVCAPHKAVAGSNDGQHDLAPFFSGSEFVTSRRTATDDDVSVEEPWPVPQSDRPSMPNDIEAPHNPAVSVLRYGPHLEHAEGTSAELADQVERLLQIPQTPSHGPFEAIQASAAIAANESVQQLPFEVPSHVPVSPQEQFDLRDGEAAAELLPIFMRQQSALEGTVFGTAAQGEQQEFGAQRNFIERIRALEAAHAANATPDFASAFSQPPQADSDARPVIDQEPAAGETAESLPPPVVPAGLPDTVMPPAAVSQDPQFADPYAPVQTPSTEPGPSADHFAVEVLRNSAEQMEHSANLMERRNLFEEADKLRGMANELRLAARVRVRQQNAAQPSPGYGTPTTVPQTDMRSVPNSTSPQPYRPMTREEVYENTGYPGEWQSSPAQLIPPYVPESDSNQATSLQPVPMARFNNSEFMPAEREWLVPPSEWPTSDDSWHANPNGLDSEPTSARAKRYSPQDSFQPASWEPGPVTPHDSQPQGFFRPVSWDEGIVPGRGPQPPFGLQMLNSERPFGWWETAADDVEGRTNWNDYGRRYAELWRY